MECSNLTRIESGKQRPTDENLEKIAKALEIELKELFDFEHIKTKEELKIIIIKMLDNYSEKELKFIFKLLGDMKQL